MVFKHCVIAAAEAWKRLKKKVLIAWDTKNFSLQVYRVINPCTALFCYDCAKKKLLYCIIAVSAIIQQHVIEYLLYGRRLKNGKFFQRSKIFF